jgi:hypothetical protein
MKTKRYLRIERDRIQQSDSAGGPWTNVQAHVVKKAGLRVLMYQQLTGPLDILDLGKKETVLAPMMTPLPEVKWRQLPKSEPEHEPIHRYFELSYAQYLTVPRSVLQSMPDRWQADFVALLEEMDDAIDWRPEAGRYWVMLKDDKGRFVRDKFQDYERGRRRIPLNKRTTK